jgi:hypothetical protein
LVPEQFANLAQTTVVNGVLQADSSLVVASAALFPTLGNFRIRIDNELIIVGAVSGTTFSSLTRGAENTTAVAHSGGATVVSVLTAGALNTFTPGGVHQFGLHSYSSFPLFLPVATALTTSAVAGANAAMWTRVLIAETGFLRDMMIQTGTAGGNAKLGVLDTGQALASDTRTCLALSGSIAVPGLTPGVVIFDPNLAVAAGQTLDLFLTFDGAVAKAVTGSAPAGIAGGTGFGTATAFMASSPPGTSSHKIGGSIATANVPATVGGTVTDANMSGATFAPFFAWRISA